VPLTTMSSMTAPRATGHCPWCPLAMLTPVRRIARRYMFSTPCGRLITRHRPQHAPNYLKSPRRKHPVRADCNALKLANAPPTLRNLRAKFVLQIGRAAAFRNSRFASHGGDAHRSHPQGCHLRHAHSQGRFPSHGETLGKLQDGFAKVIQNKDRRSAAFNFGISFICTMQNRDERRTRIPRCGTLGRAMSDKCRAKIDRRNLTKQYRDFRGRLFPLSSPLAHLQARWPIWRSLSQPPPPIVVAVRLAAFAPDARPTTLRTKRRARQQEFAASPSDPECVSKAGPRTAGQRRQARPIKLP
jgi:hypothetical protein